MVSLSWSWFQSSDLGLVLNTIMKTAPRPLDRGHKLTAQKMLRTCLCVYACSIYILRPGKKGTGGKAKDIPNTLYIIDKIGNTFARGHLTVQYSQHVRQNMFNGVRITEH